MANPKVMLQAAGFLTKMGIPYKSVKMFGKMLMINTTNEQSARVIESILNGSGAADVSIEAPEDRYSDDYAVVGLLNDEFDDEDELDGEQ